MRKEKILPILMALVLITLSGCAGEKTPSDGEGGKSSRRASSQAASAPVSSAPLPKEKKEPETVVRTLSSGVEVDAVITYPDGIDFEALPSFPATLRRLSLEGVEEALLPGQTIITRERQTTKDSRFPDAMYELVITEENSSLVCTEDRLVLFTEQNDRMLYYFNNKIGSGEYNADAFLSDQPLAFASPQACREEILAFLESLQIQVADGGTCYTLDHATMLEVGEALQQKRVKNALEAGATNEDGSVRTEADILEHDQPLDFTEEDDCYYFILQLSAGGFPLTEVDNGIMDNGGFVPGCGLRVVYGKKGIVGLELDGVYDVGKETEAAPGLDWEGALEKLDENFNAIILEGTYQVEESSFVYVPISKNGSTEVTLVPAWQFGIRHEMEFQDKEDPTQTVTMEDYTEVLLHAITGKEMLRDTSL